ncbi:MAG TPA: hypothetical protein VGI41_07440 [Candidatus Udaeobacter sp.]|jgi:uncharacterized membrane protein (DUF485 family)
MTPAESDPLASRSNGGARRIEEEELLKEVIRLSRNVLGLTLGIFFAFGIFLATNILVLKGGPAVGSHLQLLNQYFPGYRVTFGGSFLGAAYGFAVGYVSGWIIAAIYNWIVLSRHR